MMIVNALHRLKKRNLEGWGSEDGVFESFPTEPSHMCALQDIARACRVRLAVP